MKKITHRAWFRWVLSALLVIIAAACLQLIRYPIRKNAADSYVEKNHGEICGRQETKGSIVYICKTEEDSYLVALNRSVWFPHQYKVYKVTTSYRLDVNNSYEYFHAYKEEDQLTLEPNKELSLTDYYAGVFILCFSLTGFIANLWTRRIEKRKSSRREFL